MSASLRPFTLLLMSAIPSGMLDYFDYDFDHKEKKRKGLPLGRSYTNSPLSSQWPPRPLRKATQEIHELYLLCS